METLIFYIIAIPASIFTLSALVTIGEKITEFMED